MNGERRTRDGVLTVGAGPRTDGQVSARLLIRMGPADEPFAARGSTNVLRELVHAVSLPSTAAVTLSVQPTFVSLAVDGEEDEVRNALQLIVRDLVDPAVSSVERALMTVRISESERWIGDELLHARYGSRGPGRIASPIRVSDASAVIDWSHRFLVAGNAVLWSSVDLPGLDLGLPAGPARAAEPLPDVADDDEPVVLAVGNGVGIGRLWPRKAWNELTSNAIDVTLANAFELADLATGDVVVHAVPLGEHVVHVTVGVPCLAADAESIADLTIRELDELVETSSAVAPSASSLESALVLLFTLGAATDEPEATARSAASSATDRAAREFRSNRSKTVMTCDAEKVTVSGRRPDWTTTIRWEDVDGVTHWEDGTIQVVDLWAHELTFSPPEWSEEALASVYATAVEVLEPDAVVERDDAGPRSDLAQAIAQVDEAQATERLAFRHMIRVWAKLLPVLVVVVVVLALTAWGLLALLGWKPLALVTGGAVGFGVERWRRARNSVA